jgi:hypothetical protein
MIAYHCSSTTTVACLVQFPSLGRRQVLVGLLLVASGLLLYRTRHRQEAGEGVVEGLAKSFGNLERPLARAMRTARRMI